MDTIGFIGVGAMGASIASRLVAGHELLVNDRNPRAADELVAQGARFAELDEIAETCSTIFLCLPGPPQVQDLLLGRERPGAGAPARHRHHRHHHWHADRGCRDRRRARRARASPTSTLRSPAVSARAREGTALLMVGADAEPSRRVEPLLSEITSEVVHCRSGRARARDEAGQQPAQRVQPVRRTGDHPPRRRRRHRAGRRGRRHQQGQRSQLHDGATPIPQLLSGETCKPQGFTIELMLKDVRLATELAASLGHETPIGTWRRSSCRSGDRPVRPEARTRAR